MESPGVQGECRRTLLLHTSRALEVVSKNPV